MSLDRINKMLAFGLVSKMIENGPDENMENLSDLNFKELELLYGKTLAEVEACPEIRSELVESLKNYQKQYGDLNELYSAEEIAADATLQSIMLMDE